MQDEQKEPPAKERRPSFWWLFAILGILSIYWCYIVTFQSSSSSCGLIESGFAWLIGWIAVATFCHYRWGPVLSPIIIFFSGPALVVLSLLVVSAYSHLLFDAPRPRPMFHNHFIDDSYLFQRWYPPDPIYGPPGQVALADDRDNLLIVVLTGEDDEFPRLLEQGGLFQVTIHVGPEDSQQLIVIKKTYDTLIVFRPDGQAMRFPLGKGRTKEYRDKYWDNGDREDLLQAAGELLTPEEKKRFDAFLNKDFDLETVSTQTP